MNIPVSPRPQFRVKSGFRKDKNNYINAIDEKRLRRAYVQLWLKGLLMVVFFVSAYMTIWFAPWMILKIVAVVVAGVTLAGAAFNISHDFNHGAGINPKLHGNSWPIKLLDWSGKACFDAIGISSKLWQAKHNSAHHTYTNIAEHDSDIEQAPLMRLQPYQAQRPWYRYQQIYGWFMYGLVPIRWVFLGDMANWFKGRIASSQIGKLRLSDHLLFWGGKLFVVTWAVLFPWLVLGKPLLWVLVVYFAISFIVGVILAIVFQLAHAIEGAKFDTTRDGDIQTAWEIHQVETTRDFHYGGRHMNRQINTLLGWYLGGLNHQTIHHVFPKLPHTMYKHMVDDFSGLCHKHGVDYVDHSLSQALRNHYTWLKKMGREEPA